MKAILVTSLLVSLVLCSSVFESAMAAGSAFCDSKCNARCAVAGVKDRCLKYCGICCEKCKCVPMGTSGNKNQCPCYRDLKNSKGKSKCP